MPSDAEPGTVDHALDASADQSTHPDVLSAARLWGRRCPPDLCLWCGRAIPGSTGSDRPDGVKTRGRKKRYCRQSCRQRAYENRSALAATSIPVDSVVLSAGEAEDLLSRAFELRCAAEDVEIAVSESASYTELSVLCKRLTTLARDCERLR